MNVYASFDQFDRRKNFFRRATNGHSSLIPGLTGYYHGKIYSPDHPIISNADGRVASLDNFSKGDALCGLHVGLGLCLN
jgi:hypothetical protein